MPPRKTKTKVVEPKKPAYRFELKYRIFLVSDDGLLKIPKKRMDYCGELESMFLIDFDTVEDAHRAVELEQRYGDYVILPVSVGNYNS